MEKLGETELFKDPYLKVTLTRIINTVAAAAADETIRHAIDINARLACAPPPNIHLPDLAELLRVVSTAFHNRAFCFVCGDIRHWFHQLKLSTDVQRFFGLYMNYLYCVLPMGWSDIRYKKVVDTLTNVINVIRQTDDWRSLAYGFLENATPEDDELDASTCVVVEPSE